MNTYSRILAALLLAGASSGLVACGDDGKDDNGNGGSDAGETGDDGGPDTDGDVEEGDGGTTGEDGGAGEEPAPEELDKCPTHPNVKDEGQVCKIVGSTGNEIKTDLELQPVKGKMGYLISKGVFVGEDVGGGATPDASKKSVTLTIGKGTMLFGEDSLSFLLISRGSKIMAEGTAKYPIVFTTGAAGAPKPGQWGGVIINGRAPSNRADAMSNVTGEAGTGKYSGPDADDNSGVLKYVRIEFSGGKIDSVNELNGLALQGVGRKTVIDYLHVHATDDDGIEFFGGTVDAKHLILTAFADDGIDWTDGWVGNMQFAIVQQWTYTNPGSGTNDGANGIEADNNDSNTKATPIAEPTISNLTLIGANDITATVGGQGLNLRRGTKVHLHNTVILDFKTSCISVRGADSAGFVGTGLTLENSRMYCATAYQPKPATAMPGAPLDVDPAASMALFEATGAGNEKLADADAALNAPYEQSESADFSPKAASGLLEGGEVPSGSFWEDVKFIGAVGDDQDWTSGDWFKVTKF